MALFETFMTPCVLMEKRSVADGEGGFTVSWAEGARFNAAIVLDNSIEARAAEQNGLTSVFTVTVAANVPIEFHSYIKRLSDGDIFRVTSEPDDKATPATAGFSFKQCSAEKKALPKN